MNEADTGSPGTDRSASWPRRLGVAAIALAATAALYVAYWMFAAEQVRRGIDAWIEAKSYEGVSVSYRDLSVDGFPLWLDIRIAGPAALFQGPSPVEWTTAGLRARVRPWNWGKVQVDAAGKHEIVGVRRVSLAAQRLSGTFVFGRRGAATGRLDAQGVDADISKAGALRMKALALDFRWRAESGENASPLRFDLGMDDLVVPPRWATPLGRDVASLRFAGHVTGPLGDHRNPAFLREWRNAGGTIEIARLAVSHGPLRVEAEGTAALDKALQPVGAFATRVEGYMETVDALRQAGIMGAGDATAAKLVLAVIAKRPNGETPYIAAPLTLQDRVLSLESLKLAKLRVIDWSRVLGIPME